MKNKLYPLTFIVTLSVTNIYSFDLKYAFQSNKLLLAATCSFVGFTAIGFLESFYFHPTLEATQERWETYSQDQILNMKDDGINSPEDLYRHTSRSYIYMPVMGFIPLGLVIIYNSFSQD